jgi:hypothetical protein
MYVLHMGGLWKMRKGVYLSFLKAIAEGKSPNPDDFGVFMGNPPNTTDMPPDEAQDRFDKLKRRGNDKV